MTLDEAKHKNLCGPLVSKERTKKGWAQDDLAAACQRADWDVSLDVIKNIEYQRREVNDRELVTLSRVLGVSFYILMHEAFISDIKK